MYERFTGPARKAMQIALKLADDLGYEFFTPQHLLVAIFKSLDVSKTSEAVSMLIGLSVPINDLRTAAEARFASERATSETKNPPPEQTWRTLFPLVIEQMESLENDYIGTGHLLLGILSLNTGVPAADLLRNEFSIAIEPAREMQRLIAA